MITQMQRRYFRPAPMITIAVLTGCVNIADWGPPLNHPLPPTDVIAIGKLENLESEPSQFDPKDLLGHGWFSANFHVSDVEVGDLPKTIIPGRYFGHTWFREDVRFRFRLRPNEEGGYIVCKAPDASGFNCD